MICVIRKIDGDFETGGGDISALKKSSTCAKCSSMFCWGLCHALGFWKALWIISGRFCCYTSHPDFLPRFFAGVIFKENCQKGWSLPFDHFFVALRILEGDFGVGTNQPFPKAGKNHILLQNKSVNQLSDEKTAPFCCWVYMWGMKSYPVMWGLFHKPL